MPRLTTRQVAVLAAIERHGTPTLIDLRKDFPDLPPSAVLRVIASLQARGLVSRAGDEERVYLGGVVFSAAPPELQGAIDVPA